MTISEPITVTPDYPLSLCEICGTPYIKRTVSQTLCHIACYVIERRRQGQKRNKTRGYFEWP